MAKEITIKPGKPDSGTKGSPTTSPPKPLTGTPSTKPPKR